MNLSTFLKASALSVACALGLASAHAQTWDFTAATADDYNSSTKYFNSTYKATDGESEMALTDFKYHGSSYGGQTSGAANMKFAVSGPTYVSVYVSYNQNTGATVTLSSDETASIQTETLPTGDLKNAPGEVKLTYSTAAATNLTLTLSTGNIYISKVVAEAIPAETEKESGWDGKTDVWDFGAEQLSTDTYNNKLTAESIIAAIEGSGKMSGETQKSIGSVTFDSDVAFVSDKVNHRLRTTNEALASVRYDSKSIKVDDVTYTGYIYSNASSTANTYFAINLEANQRLDMVLASNGGNANYTMATPSGTTEELSPSIPATGGKLTYYASETGVHKFYTLNEKLVVCRLMRTGFNYIKVQGAVTGAALPDGASLVFTAKETGQSKTVEFSGGNYSALNLIEGFNYKVSLANANGYIISSGAEFTASSLSNDIIIEEVNIVTISGSITGLSSDVLAKAQFVFTPVEDKIYQPEMTINDDGTYELKLESGVEYDVAVNGINDYESETTSLLHSANAISVDFAFTKKPTYDITVNVNVSELDMSASKIIFTNLADDYVYEFTGTEGIQLRDGLYSVRVLYPGIYAQGLAANLTVNGDAAETTVPFEQVSAWSFASDDFDDTAVNFGWYNGLNFSGAQKNKTYLLCGSSGNVKVPVSGPSTVKVSYCFTANGTIGGVEFFTKSKSTGTIESTAYTYTGEGAGTVEINTTAWTDPNATSESNLSFSSSYIVSIEVLPTVDFRSELTVGPSGRDFVSIGEALAHARLMRLQNPTTRINIMIDPGNYEEMLLVDIDSVSFINSSETPSTALTNNGVDIDANAVRITSYYGHGYSYYSMAADYRWSAETLAVNKVNGSATTTNPGAGTGTWWNATVVVKGNGFEARNIIFENSFNQYVSAREAEDVLVKVVASMPDRPTAVGSTAVQDKSYVERACAFAVANNADRTLLRNCCIVGRQDSFFGGVGGRVVAYKCDLMGATDYIFGGMTLTAYKCNLVLNTSDASSDVAHITAAQQAAGERGYLLYKCNVISATPGVETASAKVSKPGTFGRPWSGTSETVFYQTTVGTDSEGNSLIQAAGWNDGLVGSSTGSLRCYEYGTIEESGEDNSASRVTWSTVLSEPTLPDATAITTYNFTCGTDGWDPIRELDPTAIECVPAPAADAAVASVAGGISVASAGPVSVEVFGLTGSLAARCTVSGTQFIGLPAGVWIVRLADSEAGVSTVKVAVR